LNNEDHHFLDLGCGEGNTFEVAVRMLAGCQGRGIDFMEENVAICRQHELMVETGDVYIILLSMRMPV